MQYADAAMIQIDIENLKCGGCANSIRHGLQTIDGVDEVEVDLDHHQVKIKAPESLRQNLVEKLRSMGYPEVGSVKGLEAGLASAKSFVSCAIGKVRS